MLFFIINEDLPRSQPLVTYLVEFPRFWAVSVPKRVEFLEREWHVRCWNYYHWSSWLFLIHSVLACCYIDSISILNAATVVATATTVMMQSISTGSKKVRKEGRCRQSVRESVMELWFKIVACTLMHQQIVTCNYIVPCVNWVCISHYLYVPSLLSLYTIFQSTFYIITEIQIIFKKMQKKMMMLLKC